MSNKDKDNQENVKRNEMIIFKKLLERELMFMIFSKDTFVHLWNKIKDELP